MVIIVLEIDFIVFQVGFVVIWWYGIVYVVIFIVGYQYIVLLLDWFKFWVGQYVGFLCFEFDFLLIYIVFGVIFGGWIGYIFFYQFDYYLMNFLDVLVIWKGGMLFYGGFLGIGLGILLFVYYYKLDKWVVGDLIVVMLFIGIFLVCIVNFINVEIIGFFLIMLWVMIFLGYVEVWYFVMFYEVMFEGLVLFGIVLYCIVCFKIL